MSSTIGGLSSASSSALGSIRGYGGLASGLDRDSLIEQMTSGTTAKIQKQYQQQQKIEWKMEAMRGITSKMYDFYNSFLSFTSPSCLLNEKLFEANSVTAQGVNASNLSVSGSSSMASSMQILGIKQLASQAKMTFNHAVSDQVLQTGDIASNLDDTKEFNMIQGTSLSFKYGKSYYTVELPADKEGYDYSTLEGCMDALNKGMKEVSIGSGRTLADVIQAGVGDDGKAYLKNIDKTGNTIKVVDSGDGMLQRFGFIGEYENPDDLEDDRFILTSEGLHAGYDSKLTEEKSLADQLGGKNISFTYNGKTASIQLASKEDLQGKTLADLQTDIQKKLNDTFGTGRIQVGLESGAAAGTGQLTFKTTLPDGTADPSSVLTVNFAGDRVLGTGGALNMAAGSSNRLNLKNSMVNAGLKSMNGVTISDPANTELDLTINGVKIEGLTYASSMNEIMEKINSTKEAKVNMTYQADADKFMLTSTEDGASGRINLSGSSVEHLFGAEGTDFKKIDGKDAIVAVKYEGSDDIIEMNRGSNSFSLNGLTISAKGTFGYEGDTLKADAAKEAVTFDAKIDTDKAVDAVKSMVEKLNEIIELVNDEVSTKPDRKYSPLTDEQEEEMSDKQIEKWNEKAKAGSLFNDSDLRGLADELRFLVSMDSNMKSIGITASESYADHGKLVFDEETFRAALESDPDKVKNAFMREQTKDESNGLITDKGGLMVQLQTINTKYASMYGASKGILVERAGSIYAPTTILKNGYQTELDSIADTIESLQDRLKSEQERYISQFTQLETLISQMNSQSSWLSSSFGG